MKKLLLLSLLALLALGVRSQSADKPGNWKLIASDEYLSLIHISEPTRPY